jgi:hypothetical protein
VNLKLLTFGFALLTFGVAYWLFVSWYVYSMAEFDCADRTIDVATCASAIHWKVGLRAAIPTAAWGVLGWLLTQAWKKY